MELWATAATSTALAEADGDTEAVKDTMIMMIPFDLLWLQLLIVARG